LESTATSDPTIGPTTGPTVLDRRKFLLAAGAGGATLAAGPLLAGPASAASSLSPLDLEFSIVDQQRPRQLVADGFVRLRDGFDRARSYQRLSPSGDVGTVRVSRGRMVLSGAGGFDTLLRSGTRQEAPYAAVVVDVRSFSGDADEDTVLAGLVKDAGNYVVARYDRATGTAGIEVAVDGTVRTLGTAEVDLPAPGRLAFALTSTTVVAFVDGGSGFVPVVQENLAGILDLRRPAALAAYHNGFGARSSSGAVTLGSVRAGYFGELGLRDPHLVTRADGTPYIRDGKAYLSFTQAGLAFFETAHWGVWTLDLRTFELEQVGNLFFQRDGADTVLGDHAGHIVLDEAEDRWILAMSTWGDFSGEGVQINYVTLPRRRNPLHGVHVLRTRRLPLPLAELPSAHVGQWDPHLVRIDRRWYVAFVNARAFFNFYPNLARSARGADFTSTRLVGSDDAKVETEGPVMQKFGNRWYVMASNGDNSPPEIRGQYPVYDLTMTQVGILDAPHPTNIPWPMIFPVRATGGRSRWLWVTFNGTQFYEPLLGYGTHGDVLVLEADRRTRGYPFG
jgi:hypothetical protein